MYKKGLREQWLGAGQREPHLPACRVPVDQKGWTGGPESRFE